MGRDRLRVNMILAVHPRTKSNGFRTLGGIEQVLRLGMMRTLRSIVVDLNFTMWTFALRKWGGNAIERDLQLELDDGEPDGVPTKT